MRIIKELAVLPESQFVRDSSPYHRYCSGAEVLCSSYKDVVNGGVWGYQLLVYLEEVRKKFGSEIRDRVREQQLQIFDSEAAGAGVLKQVDGPLTSLSMTMDLIEEEIRCHALGLHESRAEERVTIEKNIARTLLQYDFDSPYITRSEEDSGEDINSYRQRIEEKFSRCLLRGGDEIKSNYNMIIKNMDMNDKSCTT